MIINTLNAIAKNKASCSLQICGINNLNDKKEINPINNGNYLAA